MGIARTKWNIHLDLAAWNEQVSGLTADPERLVKMLRIECDIVGAHRVLFGTDLPGFQLPGDREESKKFVSWLRDLPNFAKKYGVNFTWDEAELIAHKNAERVMKIPEA